MNKDLSIPVDRVGLAAHYKEVEAFQRARARSSRRVSKVLAVVTSIALLGNLAQAWTIASLVPLTKIEPVYLWVRPDGSVDSSIAMSRLPATQNKAVLDAALWEYVRLREGYSYDTARYAYDVVSEMSSPNVRGAYQAFFNYPNPQSPQVRIGQKGTIEVEHISSADIATGVEQIRYRRIVDVTGAAGVTTTWTATLQFGTVTDLPTSMRLRNPGGVIVVTYQAEEDTVE